MSEPRASAQRCGSCGHALPPAAFNPGDTCPHCGITFTARELHTVAAPQLSPHPKDALTPARDPRLTTAERLGWLVFALLIAAVVAVYWSVRDTPWFARHFGDVPERVAAAERLADGGPEAVEPLLELLADEDPEVRLAATQALADVAVGSSEAVDALATMLADPSENVRLAAVRGLGRRAPNDGHAAQLLQSQLDAESEAVRTVAAGQLAHFGSLATPAVDQLLTLAARRGPRVATTAQAARQAVDALGEVAIPGLIQALDHPDPNVRQRAMNRLAQLDPRPSAVREALERATASRHKDVRGAAARALVATGAPTVGQIVALVRLADDPATRADADAGLARSAQAPHALAQITEADARVVVPRLLKYGEGETSTSRQVGKQLLDALGPNAVVVLRQELGDADDVLILKRILAALTAQGEAAWPAAGEIAARLKDRDLRDEALAALAAIGSRALPHLTEATAARDRDLRVAAIKAIGAGGDIDAAASRALLNALEGRRPELDAALSALKTLGEAGVPTLARALEVDRPFVRRKAAQALAESAADTSAAVPALLKALKKRDPRLRRDVIEALARHAAQPEVRRALESEAKSRNPHVKRAAERALAPKE